MACPICTKPTDPAHRPFCSPRCKDIDLHRWLKGSYRMPTAEVPDDGEAVEDDA
ncbi:DNA gyrase inhibitor YacG [Pseudoroseicyclus sp. H15]